MRLPSIVASLASAPRARAALLACGCALACAFAAAPALAQGARPDLSGWQALLDQYIVYVGDGKKEPRDTRFDYEQLYVDEGIWSKKASERLERVHAQLLAVPPSSMDERTRLAWALNAYNFLVVERATLHLLVPLRRFQRYETVEQMNTFDGSFFDGPFLELDGKRWSLNSFERWFVYGDSTPSHEPRARAGDPRLMFALCRASLGGPSLPARAFKPESLEVQLDRCTRAALAKPAIARWDERANTLLLSNYLASHRIDFGGLTTAMVPFVEQFGPGPLRSQIRKAKLDDVRRFTPVDPTLNQFLRPKPQAPVDPPQSKS